MLAGEYPASRWVKLACERHIKDLDREDVWFDVRAAERFFRFAECMRHYKGDMRGQPLALEPWQKFIFGNIYGWKRVEDGERTDIWRYNYAYIEVPRKNGKTTLCAAGALYDCFAIEPTGAEVYVAATKEDQAKILWKDCLAFVRQSDDLKEEFGYLQGRNTIYARHSDRTSYIVPVGSNSDRLDGLNPLAVYADELHEWRDRKLWEVFSNAFGARSNWHMIAITTAGHNKTGICFGERKHLTGILEGHFGADNKFGVIHTVDPELAGDWESEDAWRQSNPNLGTGKQISFMRAEAEKAKQQPSHLNTFLNKQLNIWTDVAESWLSTDLWTRAATKPESLAGKYCYAGIDLALVKDLSAVAYYFPQQPGLSNPLVLCDFFAPEEDIRERSRNDRVPYDLWAKEGWLTTTPGKTTDQSYITSKVLERQKQFDIRAIGYDRHFAVGVIQPLEKAGFEVKPVGMGYVSMSPPAYELERQLVQGQLRHDGNPVLAWNAGNVVLSRDPAGNIKPDKAKSYERIDGIVALLVAIAVAQSGVEAKRESVYKARGLRQL